MILRAAAASCLVGMVLGCTVDVGLGALPPSSATGGAPLSGTGGAPPAGGASTGGLATGGALATGGQPSVDGAMPATGGDAMGGETGQCDPAEDTCVLCGDSYCEAGEECVSGECQDVEACTEDPCGAQANDPN
jgi:hypothetical protein